VNFGKKGRLSRPRIRSSEKWWTDLLGGEGSYQSPVGGRKEDRKHRGDRNDHVHLRKEKRKGLVSKPEKW